MEVGKSHIGTVLAIVCLALLVSSFFLPWWTIEREERSPAVNPVVYVNSTHDFKLLWVSTYHKDTAWGEPHERSWDASYWEVEDSDLGFHSMIMASMVTLGIVFIVLFLVLNRLRERKKAYRLIALGLAFAVALLVLGSAAYMNVNLPSAVGDSRENLGQTLDTVLPDIQTFAGIDLNETSGWSVQTTWGPQIGWYAAFVTCIIMLFSIWFTESRPKTEEEPEEEPED